MAPLELVSLTWQRPVAELGSGAYALKVMTERGCERVARFAFELARRRAGQGRPGRVTCGTKHNLLSRTDGLFRETARRVAGEYPDVEFESLIVDDLANRLVGRPRQLDVVVLPNLYGDILSDAAAALAGGLGIARERVLRRRLRLLRVGARNRARSQPNTVNPTATILSAAMMLEHLGFSEAAPEARGGRRSRLRRSA